MDKSTINPIIVCLKCKYFTEGWFPDQVFFCRQTKSGCQEEGLILKDKGKRIGFESPNLTLTGLHGNLFGTKTCLEIDLYNWVN